jgi:hypothetical protein
MGRKRAGSKKGRREAIRTPPHEETFEHLRHAGFVPARPRIILPGQKT